MTNYYPKFTFRVIYPFMLFYLKFSMNSISLNINWSYEIICWCSHYFGKMFLIDTMVSDGNYMVTTIKSCLYRRGSLLAVFQHTNSYSIYQIVLNKEYQLFIWFKYTIRLPPVFLKQKEISRIVPSVFFNKFTIRVLPVFPSKQNPIIVLLVFSKKEIFRKEKVTTRSTSNTWDISKPNSIYVWDIVNNIIQRIESRIYFNSHTTDLYESKYCSKEDEDYSLNLTIVLEK